MMKSYISDRVPLSLLREEGYLRMWIASLDILDEIQLLRHMCLSSRCDGHALMHAVLEQKWRNPSFPLPCGAPTYGS